MSKQTGLTIEASKPAYSDRWEAWLVGAMDERLWILGTGTTAAEAWSDARHTLAVLQEQIRDSK